MRYLLFLLLSICSQFVSAQSLSGQPSSGVPNVKAEIDQISKNCSTDRASNNTLTQIICSGEMRFGIRTNYKSFGELNENKNVGFEIDLATAIANELGVRPIFVSVVPADRIAVLLEEKVDVVLATMAHTTTRAKVVEFVRPHYYASGTGVVGPQTIEVTDLKDLAAKPICVPLGSYANMLIAEAQARLLIFDRPARMVNALGYGACALIAHDESLLHASVTGPNAPQALREKFEQKFSFAEVPWGVAVRFEDAPSLGQVLARLIANFHINGSLIDLAKKHEIADPFLQTQQKLWTESRCVSSVGELNPECFLPGANLTELSTTIAPQILKFQEWLTTLTDIKLTFPMLTGQSSRDLFLRGIAVSVLVVVLSVMSTLLVSAFLYQMMASRVRSVRVAGSLSAIAFLNSPTILLLVLGYLVVTSVFVYGPWLAVFIAVLAIGLNNGATGAQALAEVAQISKSRAPLIELFGKAKVQLRGCVINAAKTSPVAAFIGTPELLSALTNIASFTGERYTTYWLVTLFYIAVVQAVIALSAYVVDKKYT
jgi:polar amino acid transport system substrate-binding protein